MHWWFRKPVQIYQGENAVYKFIEKMLKEVELFKEIMKKTFKKVPFISKKDVRHLKTINEYHHICNKKHFDKYIIVR